MSRFLKTLTIGLTLIGGGASAVGEAAAETTLRAISAFPKQLLFSREFVAFVEDVNKTGKGKVQIQYVGGPEVIPVPQQGDAIRNGVFDMLMGPPAYYQGMVPEGDALFGAKIRPDVYRQNGGHALLNEIWGKKLNAHFLSWGSGGVGFHIYLANEPKMSPTKGIDLSGVKLRSAPPYREWFESLGATNVMMQAAEIYTGLERKVVSGFGWPAIGFTDLGLHKFVNYRIDPPVWQLDIVIVMNKAKWDSLSDEQKDFLTQKAIAYEKASAETYRKEREKTEKMLDQQGVKIIDLQGEAREWYVENAHDITWKRVKQRAPENYDRLRQLFYDNK